MFRKTRRPAYKRTSPRSTLMSSSTRADIDVFLEEIESFCYSTVIVTLLGTFDVFKIDLHRSPDGIRYGYKEEHRELFAAKLVAAETSGVVIVRSLRDEIHQQTGFPMKGIRGYVLRNVAGRFQYIKIPTEELREAFSTDAQTGEPLEIEPELVFC